jgi:hypothetical protein
MPNPDLAGNLKSLPEALRALPQVAPERSAWPQLAERLKSRDSGIGNWESLKSRDSGIGIRDSGRAKRVRRWAVPGAFAAAIVLAVIAMLPLHRAAQLLGPQPSALSPQAATVAVPAASNATNAANTSNATNGQTAGSSADAGAQLAALHQRSQALEHWLRETARAGAPLSGQDLAAATEIEDMIGLVDGQLNAASRDSELPLWRRRVALLEDLTALRYSNYKLAETGVALR